MLCSWLCAKSKAIVGQDGRSGETRGREKNGYIEFRLARLASLARLAMPCAPCSMLHATFLPLHLNIARKWASFGRTKRIIEVLRYWGIQGTRMQALIFVINQTA